LYSNMALSTARADGKAARREQRGTVHLAKVQSPAMRLDWHGKVIALSCPIAAASA